ncbi:prepilin-type N-terminal cleavage/methylation domain-containing protein [Patescibacteria group bacterium]|nr:prepilin-type N-terminal cleavage/methylation domain-containing protein [Patescibacteria group bacterium]
MRLKRQKGFTLMEILIYLSIFTILLFIIIALTIWSSRTGSKTKLNYEIADNARRAMETMVFEIKKSQSVYWPTSVFDTDYGQLSLEQIATSTSQEMTTYIDFFKCGDFLCQKNEGRPPFAITNSQVKITKLNFSRMENSTSSSIQINLKVESIASSTRPEYAGALELTTTANLRSY